MTDRTFKQYALGFGPTPSQVVCQIEGNTVFNGTVLTSDQPFPWLPSEEYTIDNEAWTWSQDVEFTGAKTLTIAVSGSSLLLGPTLADNPLGNAANSFATFYSFQIDGITYADPFSDVTLDGVAQSNIHRPDFPGQIWWHIPAGSTFIATLNVMAPQPSL